MPAPQIRPGTAASAGELSAPSALRRTVYPVPSCQLPDKPNDAPMGLSPIPGNLAISLIPIRNRVEYQSRLDKIKVTTSQEQLNSLSTRGDQGPGISAPHPACVMIATRSAAAPPHLPPGSSLLAAHQASSHTLCGHRSVIVQRDTTSDLCCLLLAALLSDATLLLPQSSLSRSGSLLTDVSLATQALQLLDPACAT